MTISGERTEQLDIFCHVTGFTSDFLNFIGVELIRFFHGALQFLPSLCTTLHYTHLAILGHQVAYIPTQDTGNTPLRATEGYALGQQLRLGLSSGVLS